MASRKHEPEVDEYNRLLRALHRSIEADDSALTEEEQAIVAELRAEIRAEHPRPNANEIAEIAKRLARKRAG